MLLVLYSQQSNVPSIPPKVNSTGQAQDWVDTISKWLTMDKSQ